MVQAGVSGVSRRPAQDGSAAAAGCCSFADVLQRRLHFASLALHLCSFLAATRRKSSSKPPEAQRRPSADARHMAVAPADCASRALCVRLGSSPACLERER